MKKSVNQVAKMFKGKKCVVFVNDSKDKYSDEYIDKVMEDFDGDYLVILSYNKDLLRRILSIRSKKKKNIYILSKNRKKISDVNGLLESFKTICDNYKIV